MVQPAMIGFVGWMATVAAIGLLALGLVALVFSVMGGWGFGIGARLFITATPDEERTRKAGTVGMLVVLLWVLFGASFGFISRDHMVWAACAGLVVGVWRLAAAVRRWYRTQWWRAVLVVLLAFVIGGIPAAAVGFGEYMAGVMASASMMHDYLDETDSGD